ncbi:hypothetical protein LZD49_02740 [Dyadobacter sp. CY261]|uniref:hypothetical protein n=1 Tax=Dyadobacter sp. CY261 TaxID=2907203 RepID=UPI001F1A0CA2|nr:hypothetical protein [Dyadobacter sp. CY261]MCF0069369.1 hypothetical protein [Dyadobacter sp. CY261]
MRLKIPFTTFLLLAVCIVVIAQKTSLEMSSGKIIDTTATYSRFKADVVKIGLEDLMKSKDKLRFRFWCKNQLVEIWSGGENTYLGKLISYTSKYDPKAYSNPVKKEKIFTKHIAIDTIVAKRIYERAMDISLLDIAGQENIKGWKQGVDGYSVLLEYSDPLKYYMKDYWSPDFQVAVPEAKLIDDFEAFLETTLGLHEKWPAFIDGLPKGCYSAGGVIICIGRKEARRLRKQH